ncbi:MAG: hypothetical protein IT186_24880 [Acidobacteria bacterium]|nr:hypothetical protein [Acidobacteriota bacterium]MCG3195533.1 hypothetical protein [Thermoanaerobaculia bacterium]
MSETIPKDARGDGDLRPGARSPGTRSPGAVLVNVTAFAVFCGLTVLMTWPWARELPGAVPDPGDPFLNSWILWWDWFQTFRDPLHLFDGNIFYPHRLSLAFSEHNYGIALPLFPLFFLGASPILVHGVATLLGFAFSGFAAWRLTRTLTDSTPAAYVAGIAFAFLPYRFHLLSHVNYVSTGWLLLVLEAVVLFSRKPSNRQAVWLGTAFLMHGLTCLHWLVLSAVPLLVSGLLLALRSGTLRDPGFWRRGCLAVGTAGTLLVPFLWPYHQAAKVYGFARTLEETRKFSATAADWLRPDPKMKTWAFAADAHVPAERALFPGVTLPALSLLGLALALSRRQRAHTEALAVGGAWTVLGFVGSLGTNAFLHPLLFAVLSPYRSIRAPARWGMLAMAGLTVLAALGIAILAQRRDPRGRAVLGLALSALVLFEFRAAPLELHFEPEAVPPVYAAIGKAPLRGGIVEFPVSGTFDTSRYTLRAADHGKPLITATSGFIPETMRTLERLTAQRPIPDSLFDLLEAIPASVVVLHESRLDMAERAAYRNFLARGFDSGRLKYIDRFGELERDEAFVVTKTEPAFAGRSSLPFEPPSPQSVLVSFREDDSLPASLDEPTQGARVSGDLHLKGWARTEGEDLQIEIRIGEHTREPRTLVRTPRDDVQSALPRLGDCGRAGFEAVVARLPGDRGPDRLTLVVSTKDGRRRTYPTVPFNWE